VFQAQFPAPGAYKAWAQFQHQGAVVTAPFEIEVVSPLAALEARERERDGAGGR
jgi:hypothetical protein